MTTKEQERKALAQIKKIMDGLEADSYINTAFAGCLEIAESNIENDFACSMKDRAETAEKKAAKLELDNRDLRDSIKRIKEETSKRITALEARTLTADDLCDCLQLAEDAENTYAVSRDDAERSIVENAEAPESRYFKDAVMRHRRAVDSLKYCNALANRIRTALNAASA